MVEDNIVVKKIEGGSIVRHPPLFSKSGRLVNSSYLNVGTYLN